MEITAKLLTKNWALNLAGQLLPMIVAVATMPYVIRGLGAERFGILSIAWALLGYTTLLDLGLGRATTKFVAEHVGRGETHKLPGIVWTSVWAQAFLGLTGALLFAALTPPLVERILKISVSLRADAKISFFILAAALPVVLIGNTFRGVLEASQRFDAVTYVRIPANVSIFLAPAAGLAFGCGLPGIVSLLVLARLGATVAYLVCCLKHYPALRRHFSTDSAAIRKLLVYGGWVTVSNVVSPLMIYLDRFFIGSIVSMAAVGYYTAPYEAIARASILPGSLTATIFPAFSSLDAVGSSKKLEELCVRSLKSLLLALGPVLLLIAVFAHEILRVWLGPGFAAKGTTVLQILAAGTLFNCLAYVPYGLLQGLGRPDLTAKFHLLELPLYVVLLWFLVRHMGIAGAALAWTVRVSVDAILLFAAAAGLRFISTARLLGGHLGKTVISVAAFGVLLGLPWFAEESLWERGVFAGVLLFAFVFAAWKYLLDARDRNLLVYVFGQLRTSSERTK